MELNEHELSIAELEASHTFKEQPMLNTSRSDRLCGNQPLTNSPKRALNADPENHKVAFSKQLNGLLKEARQLSNLSDAEVAVIVFSTTGKLGEFASSRFYECRT
ncbi:hypothetical protein KP509_22G017600 [Ceratopteris richardii]|uniref:MADS-box domain-containing protein n=1 Tax=Ceratopteris richardii TaxID=49495 RepID=A0A8T2S3Z6_CERRI|nr:hypothetical protein KP509_22G017600 [Ceratopteris richardii]KAH7306539.1 hypothetical protein KP509_22G017600 [Ceratopteris richardii]